jgi:N-acetylneuraminic acid mutarotase
MARSFHTAALLKNGKVLVVGGSTNWQWNTIASGATSTAELYDPATGKWSMTGAMSTRRVLHSMTFLPDGRVLVAGGFDASNSVASAELYDPQTETWSPVGEMNSPHMGHVAVLLSNQTVLVVGGTTVWESHASPELYNLNEGKWQPLGPPIAASYGVTATVLPDGSVLIAGGRISPTLACFANVELYIPPGVAPH